MNISRNIWWILCIILILVMVGVCFVYRSVHDKQVRRMVNEYEMARVLPPRTEVGLQVKVWIEVFPLPSDVTASLTARQGLDRIKLRYSDETRYREVVGTEGYACVFDIRIANDGSFLFVKTSGWAGGIVHESYLYKYNLRERHLDNRVSIQ